MHTAFKSQVKIVQNVYESLFCLIFPLYNCRSNVPTWNWKHWLYSNLVFVENSSLEYLLNIRTWATNDTNMRNTETKILTEALNLLWKMPSLIPIQCFRMRCSCVYHNNLGTLPDGKSKSAVKQNYCIDDRWMGVIL